jgi:hypothetical protein
MAAGLGVPLDLAKYIGPEEAEAFPVKPLIKGAKKAATKVTKAAKKAKRGMSGPAKAMAKKAQMAEKIGHHAIPLEEGLQTAIKNGDVAGIIKALDNMDWHLMNLPEVMANPETVVKDIPRSEHIAKHAARAKEKYAKAKATKKGAGETTRERIATLSPEDKQSLLDAMQARREYLQGRGGTISAYLTDPEYRRGLLQTLEE